MDIAKHYNLKVVNFFDPDKNKKLLDYHEKGGLPGLELGFNCLSQHYTHKQSGVTDWTGYGSSGKTYFVLELLIQMCEKYNKRFALYAPDIGTYYELFAKLVKMYTGKDFEKKYHNQIAVGELMNRIPQISKDFVILIKDNFKKPLAPVQVWEAVAEYRDDLGKLDGVLIDSWKDVFHDFSPYSGREDLYLDATLSYRNLLAEEGNIHIHTIAHPVKTELTDEKNKQGKRKRRVPDENDIKGGNAWKSNGKNILSVDRPDKDSNSVDIYVCKTKPENVGREGVVLDKLFLDLKKGRYYEMINGHKMYAFDHLTQDYSIDNYLSPREQQKISTQQGIKNMSAATNVEKSQVITKDDLPIQNPFEDFSNPPF